MEIWKDIKNYEGHYQVSSFGNIRSLNYRGTKTVKLLKLLPNKAGYINVQLCKFGISKGNYVHRLVAEHFIDNPDNLLEVNHIDENKQNNNILNLEWVTRSQNIHHSLKNKTSKYIGVLIDLRSKNYRAYIHIKGKYISLGTYKTELEAFHARNNYEILNNLPISNYL